MRTFLLNSSFSSTFKLFTCFSRIVSDIDFYSSFSAVKVFPIIVRQSSIRLVRSLYCFLTSFLDTPFDIEMKSIAQRVSLFFHKSWNLMLLSIFSIFLIKSSSCFKLNIFSFSSSWSLSYSKLLWYSLYFSFYSFNFYISGSALEMASRRSPYIWSRFR